MLAGSNCLGQTFWVKLSDRFAFLCEQLVDITILKRRVAAGTEKPPATLWTAPEVLRSGAPTPASDVFAFGILLYQMVYRREPYEDEDIEVRPIFRTLECREVGFTLGSTTVNCSIPKKGATPICTQALVLPLELSLCSLVPPTMK